jgi:hypothetical protein
MKHAIRNWSEYNVGLKQKGSLTFMTIKSVYHQPGRQTQELLDSLLMLMNVNLDVRIRRHRRKKWKREANYHRRSLAKTIMFRQKTIFGGKVRAGKFEN